MVKPSAMLQMLIANPSTAQKIDRYSLKLNFFGELWDLLVDLFSLKLHIHYFFYITCICSRYPNILKIGTHKITTQSSAEKWKEMKFHWGKSKTMDFILGEIIEFSHKEKTLLGKIRQFMVKECDQVIK
jgi:hypothetical protein